MKEKELNNTLWREMWEVKCRRGRKRWKNGEEMWRSASGHRGGGVKYLILD